MYRQYVKHILILSLASLILVYSGCSSNSPVVPSDQVKPVSLGALHESGNLLLGYWHVDIDPVSWEVTAVQFRQADFHLNTTSLLEKVPPFMIIPQVLALDVAQERMAVKVTVSHPDPTPLFVAFDVRGIVFTNSTYANWNDSDLYLPSSSDDFYLRNPDGYTRWWNPAEFSIDDLGPLSKYVDGKQAPDYTGSGDYDYNGTVNPYKYFITGHPDGFNVSDPYNMEDGLDLLEYFSDPANFADQAAIQPGSMGSRIYQFRVSEEFFGHFGFNYAIDGSWALPANPSNPTLEDFPPRAHMAEPFLLDFEVEKNGLYYFDEYTNGGELSFLATVWDWQNYHDPSFYEANTPSLGINGALRIIGRNGFMSGDLPSVEFVSSDEDIKSMTYRLTFTNPVIPGLGLYGVMLIAEHCRTYPVKFDGLEGTYRASYLPKPASVTVLPVVPEPFELPYNDPMDLTTDDFWRITEYMKSPPFQPVSPQPAMTDGNYYHWGLSDSGETWSSQVHYVTGQQVQDLDNYADDMRNALISPMMVYPDSGAIKVTISHTFSMQPFDDFGEMVFMWEPGIGEPTYHPFFFYHFTGELPGNTSGIEDGARHDTYYIDRLTSFVGPDVETFHPTPGGNFRLAFFFDTDEDVNATYLGWEIDNLIVEETLPWDDPSLTETFNEHFDPGFSTQDMWSFINAGGTGEHWGLIEFTYPGNDGTFLDACYELSSVYDSGINEEAVLTITLPESGQINLEIRHRLSLDPGSCAFIAVDDIDGDDAGEEFTVLYPCYFGGLLPYSFTRGTVFSSTIDPGGDNNVAEGWGHFCFTGQNPGGFNTVAEFHEGITTYFDLTTYAGQEIDLRFIFRTGDEIIEPFFPFTNTNYASWRIEEVTIKSL